MKYLNAALHLLTLSFLLLAGPTAFAESNSANSSQPPDSNSNNSGNNANSGGGTSTKLPGVAEMSAGTFSPITMQKVDMAKKSKVIAAAERAMASNSKNQCEMMRNQALQEEDKDKQMMLLLLAQQSCDQAESAKKSAEENEKNEEKMSDKKDEEQPKMASFSPGKFVLEEQKDQPNLLVEDAAKQGKLTEEKKKESSAVDDILSLSTFKPDYSFLKAKATPAPGAAPAPEPKAPVSVSQLKGLPERPAAADGTLAQLGGPTSPSGNPGPFQSLAGNQANNGGKPAEGYTPANGTGAEAKTLARKGKGESDSADNSGPTAGTDKGGTSGSDAGGGNEAFNDLLRQMMGGSLPNDVAADGRDVIALPEEDSKNASANYTIFDLASWRYQKATFEENRVKPSGSKGAARSLAMERAPRAGS